APYHRFATLDGTARGAGGVSSSWAQFVFLLDDLPTSEVRQLRARIDLGGQGEIWIDQVELFDLAFTPEERVELTKLIALADLKLKSGQFSDCARLLDGYWPRFLLATVPLTQTPASVAQRPTAVKPRSTDESAKKPR